MLWGIDVSDYQGFVVWHMVKRAGAAFSMTKATEGCNWEWNQATLKHNWPNMRKFGLVRGAYHFFHPDQDPAAQVDTLHQWARSNGRFEGQDFVALDLEITGGQPADRVVEAAEEFVQKARRDIAKPVVFYTYPDFWLHVLGDPRSRVLESCPLWLASYPPSGRPDSPPGAFAGWPVTSFWQYSQTGRCPGVAGAVDLNVFLGNRAQLLKVTAPL